MLKLILLSTILLLSGCKETPTKQARLITKPMLWKISKDGIKSSYLFGTYHTKNPKITSLNQTILNAFNSSDKLYTEITLSQDESIAINKFTILKKPIPLSARLSTRTIKKIQKVAPDTNMRQLASLKTWAIAILLDNQINKNENDKFPMMDEKLVELAKNSQKERGALEEWREQLNSFDTLSRQEQEELLFVTLNASSQQERLSIDKWYLSGDIDAYDLLEKKFLNNSRLYKKIIVNSRTNRNKTMARRIDIIISSNSNKSYFFAVGAAHMALNDGIIELLKSKGYQIKRIKK